MIMMDSMYVPKYAFLNDADLDGKSDLINWMLKIRRS